MKYRRLGASGLKVSEICLGAWINFGERIDDPQTFAVIDAAVEEGIDFFDTADVYAGGKAEEVMGRWMQGKDRRTFTIATNSGVGWEDAELHDGKWDFTAACMRRDEARQIAHGAAFHAMSIRVYKTEPQWEPDLYDKVCAFLKTQTLARQIRREPLTVALYQPTWGTAALPAQSAKQPFLPNHAHAQHLTKMIGLVESFGLPYRLITETDLLDPQRLRPYKHLIVPLWDALDRILDADSYRRLAADKRVLKIPLADRPLTRTALRAQFKQAGLSPRLDFDADTVLAGRVSNLVYNWTNGPLTVRVPETPKLIELTAHEYRLL